MSKEYTLGDTIAELASEAVEGSSAVDQLTEGSEPLTYAEAFRKALDEKYNVTLTQEEKKEVQSFMTGLRLGGPAGVGLICAGDQCDFKNACPLYQIPNGSPVQTTQVGSDGNPIIVQPTKAPVGEPCPLEAAAIMETRLELSQMVELDTQNAVVRRYISEICQISALEWRANMKLAWDFHGVTQQVPAAVSPQGEVFMRAEISPAIELLEKLSTRRSRLLKELVIHPEAQYKKRVALKQSDGDSLSRAQAEKMSRLKEAKVPSTMKIPEHVHTGEIPEDDPTEGPSITEE